MERVRSLAIMCRRHALLLDWMKGSNGIQNGIQIYNYKAWVSHTNAKASVLL